MSEAVSIPTWAENSQIHDAVFAEAYDGQSGERRAWLKKMISQIYVMDGPRKTPQQQARTQWDAGFASLMTDRVVDFAVVVMGSQSTSGPQAVAAALPAVLSGARTVCGIRPESMAEEADAVLAGMELCGMETVLALSEADAERFLAEMSGQGAGAIILHGCAEESMIARAALTHASQNLQVWRTQAVRRIGVFADGADWDYETLMWAHPEATLDVWNAGDDVDGTTPRTGDANVFMQEAYDAVFVPEALLSRAAGGFPLVLGAGQEGCWAWPGLSSRIFRASGLALTMISA